MSDSPLSRRAWLATATTGVAALATGRLAAALPTGAASAAAPAITIYKTAECGCCQKWVLHVAQAGFRPAVHDVADLDAVKQRHRIPGPLQSCHTALVDGYLVEGHVPAADIQRLLRERPKVRGIAVAGMPAGSPGMEVPDGRTDRYDVVAFLADGSTRRFASH